jgi:hypothetical protein
MPDKNLDGVAFMYRSAEEAARRERLGGSAFIVGRRVPNAEKVFGHAMYVPFLVSNRHVVFEGSACVATFNRRDGGAPEILDLDQNDWHAHPGGDDLAATCLMLALETSVHKISFIAEERFVQEAQIDEFQIGVGDDIFMIGRFVNHQGDSTNLPAVRFGNVSVMPTTIRTKDPNGLVREQLSYAVEMRSRTGFSGSPVCVYRTEGSSLMPLPKEAEHMWGLLGVNWGYVPDEEGENTWLNGVVPAWKITELLDSPPLKAAFDHWAAHIDSGAAA